VSNSQRQLAQQNKGLSVIMMVGSWLAKIVERNGLLTNPSNLAAVIHHNTTDGDFLNESGCHSLHTRKFCVICDYEFSFWRSRT
jgi:hypothetical protein